MKIIKKLSNKTWTGDDGKARHYVNFFIELDNGKRIAFKTVNASDLKVLEGVAQFERNRVPVTKDEK